MAHTQVPAARLQRLSWELLSVSLILTTSPQGIEPSGRLSTPPLESVHPLLTVTSSWIASSPIRPGLRGF